MKRKRAATPLPGKPETPLEEVSRLLKEERNKWRKRFAIWGLVAVAFFVNQVRISHVANEAKTAARSAQVAADKAQDATRLVVDQRSESRRNLCLKDQKFARAHNSLVYALAHSDPGRTAAEQAKVDEQAIPHYVAVPDCSPAGIAAFYAGQGGTNPPELPTASTTTAPSTAKPAKQKRTTTTTGPTSTTRRPSTSTTTTFRSSPTTTATPCTGITLPGGLPCL